MNQLIAMLIEVSGVQEYIFGSNELAQNIGASELVTQATTDWLFAERDGLLPTPNNVRRSAPGDAARWQLSNKSLADGLAAEVVYAGGGNALVLLANEEKAQTLSYRLTGKALREAPGLRLIAIHRSYDPGQLSAAVGELHDRIATMKRSPRRSAPLPGLGVTAACDFTGAPAVSIDQYGRYVSAEVKAKQTAGRPDGTGNDRLTEYLGDVQRHGFEFVYDFDKLGVRDESAYLAVVHTDGNRMGERIRRYTSQFLGDDRAYILGQRKFSVRVQEAAHAALVSTVGLLLAPDNLVRDQDGRTYKIGGKVPVPLDDGGKERLPFRPIVFGGDDVSFVCDGRLGLPLAAHYLSRLAAETMPDGDPLHARGGVAIVKTHYPFARAYALSEELCDSAKAFIQESDRQQRQVTALDWHFAVTGLVRPLEELRRREYAVADGSLLLRPLRLAPAKSSEWRSWSAFSEIVEELVSPNGIWAGKRNKLKALREALRSGPESVRLLLQNLPDSPELPVPAALASAGDAATTGWQGSLCLYFDAVETVDFYVPLREM